MGFYQGSRCGALVVTHPRVEPRALAPAGVVVHHFALAFLVVAVDRDLALGELLQLIPDLHAVLRALRAVGSLLARFGGSFGGVRLLLAEFRLALGEFLGGVRIGRRRRRAQLLGLLVAGRRLVRINDVALRVGPFVERRRSGARAG